MAETSFASLSPTLLARKGGAKPAMRPQHAALASIPQSGNEAEALEDLGWNDMGDAPAPAPTAQVVAIATAREVAAPAPVVHEQQANLARRIATPRASKAPRGNRAAFTLRLDAERHLKLRLATTMRDCSAQALVTEALDALLAAMPGLDTLAAQVKRR